MNDFFKWTFTVRRNGRSRPGSDDEMSAAASPVSENGRDRPEARAREEGDSSFAARRQVRQESDIGIIADCARKQIRFLRRMNDLLKSRADGAYYL